MSMTKYIGDGPEMIPDAGTRAHFRFLKGYDNCHVAICYCGPYASEHSGGTYTATSASSWQAYTDRVNAFFKDIGATVTRTAARYRSDNGMGCFYMEAAVLELPSDDRLNEFVARLNNEWADVILFYRL